MVKNCISRLCTNPLGDAPRPPPPPRSPQYQNKVTHEHGLKHALHTLDGHVVWSQYQKINFEKFNF